MSTISWATSTWQGESYFASSEGVSDMKPAASNQSTDGILLKWNPSSRFSYIMHWSALGAVGNYICISTGKQIGLGSDGNRYTTVPQLVESLRGVWLYYVLETPVRVNFASNLQDTSLPLLSSPIVLNVSTVY